MEFDIRQQMTEKEQDNALRPLCFADFAGQSKVTSNLKIFVEAAKLRNESLDHVLLFGADAIFAETEHALRAGDDGASPRLLRMDAALSACCGALMRREAKP